LEDCLDPRSKICLVPKFIIDAGGYHLLTSRICFILGIIFNILGISSDALNTALGLNPISWFLLAIGVFVAGIPPCLGWVLAAYLKFKSIEAKKKE